MSKQNFKLDNSFYPENIVRDAIQSFDGYTLTYKDNTLTVEDDSPQVLFDEFVNYCAALSNESLS